MSSARHAFKGIWRYGIGNVLVAVYRLARVMLGMSTFSRGSSSSSLVVDAAVHTDRASSKGAVCRLRVVDR